MTLVSSAAHLAARPAPWSASTTLAFWDDPHVSASMLAAHLDPDAPGASRRHDFVDASVAWLVPALDLRPGSAVLDLGCGPGVYAHRLARRGVHVTGIDISTRSIAYADRVARADDLPATFVRGDYLTADLRTPPNGYDAALLIYEDYCVLSPDRRATLLTRVRDALRQGAPLLLDVTAAPRFDQVAEGAVTAPDLQDGFWAPSPYVGTLEVWRYDHLRLVLDRYTIERAGDVRQFWNWMQCLTPGELLDELAAAGLGDVDVLGDVAGAPYSPQSPTFAAIARTGSA